MLGSAVCATGSRLGHDVIALAHGDLDITDAGACEQALDAHRPDAAINCAAWTDVDGAEEHGENSLAANGRGAGNVARAAALVDARVIQISTDYVFNGSKREPWVESDAVDPLSAYGLGKLRGEEQVADATERHTIVRTSWLFGAGGANFVDTMLALGGARDEVSVVTDQVGCPTWTGHLAGAIVELAERDDYGIHHVAGAGACSWNELAVEVFDQAALRCRVLPTTSEHFPRPAPRPAYSVLGTERRDAVALPRWQDGVHEYLASKAVAA